MVQAPGSGEPSISLARRVDYRAILDGLTQAALVFDADNRFVHANASAQAMFARDIGLIQAEGWTAAVTLLSARSRLGQTLDQARAEAHAAGAAVPFQTFRAGEYVSAAVTVVTDRRGAPLTVLMIDRPDWFAIEELLDRFLVETGEAIETTYGHAGLIDQVMRYAKPGDSVQKLAGRISGFTRLINVHMIRSRRLLELMGRLEDVRLSNVRLKIAAERGPLALDDFIHGFLDEVDYTQLADPESSSGDIHERISVHIAPGLFVAASPTHLAAILRDILRNAIMYSAADTPVGLVAQRAGSSVQISVIDEGAGIRTGESERVFLPFQRARQPQVLAEFGYGLSLFLCRHETEAMGGRIWYESEEGVGTTFSLKLPSWNDESGEQPAES